MVLHRYFGHETLACGWENNDYRTMSFLVEWADLVIVMHEDFIGYLPTRLQGNASILHVGEDIWGNPFHEDLQLKIFDGIMANPVLRNGKNPDRNKVYLKLLDYQQKIKRRNTSDMAV